MPTENATDLTTESSEDDILASMMPEVEDVPEDDEVTLEGNTEEPVAEVEEGESEEEAAEDAPEDTEEEVEAQQEELDEEYLDVDDEDTIEVVIDGKATFKTIKEAKEALSLVGASRERFEEAAKLRSSLEVSRREDFTKLETQRNELTNLISSLDGILFKPAVEPADDRLRTTDPKLWIHQDTLYKEDQARLVQGRNSLGEHIAQHGELRKQSVAKYAAQQSNLLVEKMPVFKDKEKAQGAMDDILAAAEHYGISKQELADLPPDHRQFMMAYDAYQYVKLQKARKTRGNKKVAVNEGKRPSRKLRAGKGATRSATQSTAKQQKAAIERARKSGSVDDVLATM